MTQFKQISAAPVTLTKEWGIIQKFKLVKKLLADKKAQKEKNKFLLNQKPELFVI
ncbi:MULTISPECIES: hypothetical protein [unclassified Nostoc]|uniref:hypothetical protein n=1 Tax=unclassified Nostoc TaxID=2593658 RepID=UPI001E0D6AB1|nr:hypothetical protein [Nostoc sp. JL23]MBN3876123.1 hypothetical protein [Nostoc sp. JL23]